MYVCISIWVGNYPPYFVTVCALFNALPAYEGLDNCHPHFITLVADLWDWNSISVHLVSTRGRTPELVIQLVSTSWNLLSLWLKFIPLLSTRGDLWALITRCTCHPSRCSDYANYRISRDPLPSMAVYPLKGDNNIDLIETMTGSKG